MAKSWPDDLVKYINGFPDGHLVRLRRDRMLLSGEQTGKAWEEIAKVAKEADTLPHVFLLLPDGPTTQPYDAIYGKRTRTPDQEVRYYAGAVAAINKILPLLNGIGYRHLMQDIPQGSADADPEVWGVLRQFDERSTRIGLLQLRTILQGTKPHAKRLSKDKNDAQAARSTYTIQVADLNRYLTTPKHTALATLARANCPDVELTPDAVKKAWSTHCPTR